MSSNLPPPAIRRLSDLRPGERGTFFALLAERGRSQTREGKPFYTCRFRDTRRTATYMVWEDGPHFAACESSWQPGQFFKINARYEEHERYGPQIDVLKIRPVEPRDEADGFKTFDFVEGSRSDPTLLLSELRELIQSAISDGPLQRLTLGLIDRHADLLKRLPASDRKFYPFAGGWLEHTLSVARNAIWLAEQYRQRFPELKPPINRDLVAAGAVLHDIGRARELTPGEAVTDPTEPTIDGRLLGHLFLGRDLVRDAAREQGDVNPELLALLEHLIVSHLNHPEWGSPRLPLIPEALILHHADDLDAKMEMFARCLTRDPSPGPFTERDPVLGRHLFKGRQV
jgi:3'-5' exoribonuclease